MSRPPLESGESIDKVLLPTLAGGEGKRGTLIVTLHFSRCLGLRARQGRDTGSDSSIGDNNNSGKGQERIKADSVYATVCENHC